MTVNLLFLTGKAGSRIILSPVLFSLCKQLLFPNRIYEGGKIVSIEKFTSKQAKAQHWKKLLSVS